MKWTVVFHEDFEPEFDAFSEKVQNELLAEAAFVEIFGPKTGRPHVDTLKGSGFRNMKELRFEAENGEWRVAFVFDPKQRAILLVAGDKTGVSQKKFYKALIRKADERYSRHIERVKAEKSAETIAAGKGRKR
jgi:hypothetical protein